MNKKKVIFVFSILSITFIFCGCLELNTTNENSEDRMFINFFNASPAIINKGDTANISWNVSNALYVEINMGLGSVSNYGSRDVSPYRNATYVLTASNLTHSINASVYIIVNSQDYNNDFNNPPYDLTISGENNGYTETEYIFDIIAFDYDEDDLIKYNIDWGDGKSFSSDYFESGFTYQISHEWLNEGAYEIKVYAQDKTNALSETKKHIITIIDKNIENSDGDTPSVFLSKSEGISSKDARIRVDSISVGDILWDDVDITLVNITTDLTSEIVYVPMISITDDYISNGDIFMLYGLTEGNDYKLIFTYIPSSGSMGSISWTQ